MSKFASSEGIHGREGAHPDENSSIPLLGIPIDALDFEEAVERVIRWAIAGESRTICAANVHMLMEARGDEAFQSTLREADLVLPDGMPLVWFMRRRGNPKQERIAGMDFLPALCLAAEKARVPVFFLGSTEETLRIMQCRLKQDFPALRIAGMESPPFRSLGVEEEEAMNDRICASGARIVFVSLGCPKQERWMQRHRGKIPSVMLGVGAAFPVFAGTTRMAPQWLRDRGLEWSFRLLQEPRRLWKRYLRTNIPFLVYALNEQMKQG